MEFLALATIVALLALAFVQFQRRAKRPSEIEQPISANTDLPSIDELLAWKADTKFPAVDWTQIGAHVQTLEQSLWNAAFSFYARVWVNALAASADPSYVVDESPNFILMAPEIGTCRKYLDACEETRETLMAAVFRDLNFTMYGKHVVLLWRDAAAMVAYLEDLHGGKGRQALPGGVCVRSSGYIHICAQLEDESVLPSMLDHEMVHCLASPGRWPLWLEEGIAALISYRMRGIRYEALSHEAVHNHKRVWRRMGLQRFWSGEAFFSVDLASYAYQLARVLVGLILDVYPRDSKPFLRAASYDDFGESAAQENLGVSLGRIATEFLGPGEWDPIIEAEGSEEPVS